MRSTVRLYACLGILTLPGTATAQGIVGSDHDLSGQYGITEVCIPCHTPHNADTTVPEAPLWNHELTTATFTMYTTLQGRTGDPDGASKLCLSCHDGNVAIDSYGGNTGSTYLSGDEVIGTDLTNDHPIGLSYPPPAGKYATADQVRSAGLRLPNDGTDDRIECQSCHDPHLTTNGKFLRMDNTDSALCRTCHTL